PLYFIATKQIFRRLGLFCPYVVHPRLRCFRNSFARGHNRLITYGFGHLRRVIFALFLGGLATVLDPRDLAPAAFMARARALGAPDDSIRRLSSAVVRRGIHDPIHWGRDFQIPRKLREAIGGHLPRLQLESSLTSPTDNFQKLLFRAPDGLTLESVLI